MPDIRSRVVEKLVELLRWDHRKAVTFLDAITEAECDDIMEHVRESREPIVGVAAVVYRVRIRLAGSDRAAMQRAGVEANEHHRLIPKQPSIGRNEGQRETSRIKKAHHVAHWGSGARRREEDRR